MTLEAARIAVACLLWGVASSAYSAAEPGPEHPRSPELVEAWQLLGEDQRALREARQLAVEEPESWRAQAAYIEAASHSHLRWAVVDEYRWLAEQHPDRPELAALVCWAELLQARGAELDGALARLERLSEAAGRPGALLLADGLLYAGAHERAAELLLGARPPAAMALRVEALVGAGAHREAAKLVSFALREHPRHPEVGAALWQRGVPARQVQRARQRAVEAAERLLDSEDPNELFAAWSILARAKQTRGAQRAADGLAGLVPGLVLPPRLPYGPLMLQHLGEGLARTGQEAAPVDLTDREAAAVAAVRARTLRNDGLVDQARRAYLDAIEADGSDPELLLEAAALHLDVEPQRSLAWVGQALLLLASEPSAEPSQRRERIARGLELQAGSLHALERHDQALSYQLVASLLEPSPGGLEQLAALQERQGSTEAALESLALAASLGSPRARDEMERLYRGPASVEALIRAASADLQRWTQLAEIEAAPPQSPPLRGVSLSTTAGDLSFDALEGRVVVLVFWASWCAPCAQELPLVASLRAGWVEEGLPVEVVALSVDEREADYRRGVKRFEELGLALAWAPELARELEIRAVPATRLVSPSGAIDAGLQGFHEGHDERLDALVRSLLEPREQPTRNP
jgi:thiol-disulfide isomerase/thioredoxin/tetratricopeptide (TPR) repeat protein